MFDILCLSGPFLTLFEGTGASGKSTFLKQLKVLHKEGFSTTEIEQFKESLPMNCIQAMQKLVQGFLDGNNKVSSKTKVPPFASLLKPCLLTLSLPFPDIEVFILLNVVVVGVEFHVPRGRCIAHMFAAASISSVIPGVPALTAPRHDCCLRFRHIPPSIM